MLMLTSLASNAVSAKSRAIYGSRLRPADYQELLRQKSVSDVAAYLKNSTSYSEYLRGIDDVSIHRGQLENLLNRSLYEKYIGLCHFDFSGKKSFYRYVIVNAEIKLILRAIMLLNSNSPQEIVTNLPSFLQKYASFDFLELSKVKTFADVLNVLKETPYRDVIKRYDNKNGEIDVSSCELSIKTYYYKSILSSIDSQFKGKVRNELRIAVLIEIEITNLGLIYRLKRHFKMPEEEIRRRILPFYYRLNPHTISLLLGEGDREEFIRHMRLSTYNCKMKDITFNYIEDYTKTLMFLIVHKAMSFSTSAPVVFFSLMSLMRIEIDNITTIIEGIRYQVSSQDIQKIIITE